MSEFLGSAIHAFFELAARVSSTRSTAVLRDRPLCRRASLKPKPFSTPPVRMWSALWEPHGERSAPEPRTQVWQLPRRGWQSCTPCTRHLSAPAAVKANDKSRSTDRGAPALNSRSSVDPQCRVNRRPGRMTAKNHFPVLRGFWSRPIERNVLAGLTIGLPLQPQSVHPMRCSLAPGSHLSRADLRARRV
jgi:hypothetical protein